MLGLIGFGVLGASLCEVSECEREKVVLLNAMEEYGIRVR